MGTSKLAPEHMTDLELWAFLQTRMMSLRLAIQQGDLRDALVIRLDVIEDAAMELAERWAQGRFF